MTALLRRVVRALPLLALVLACWWLLPEPLGGATAYLQVSGTSMEPGMHTGDLAITRRRAAYSPGDVVAFRVPEGEVGEGAVVIHRITGGSARAGYVTRGDNRDLDDPWRPRREDVVGELWLHVPGAARWVAAVRAPLPLAVLAAGLTLVCWSPRRSWAGG